MTDDPVARLSAGLDADEAAANRALRFAEGRERDCPDADLVEICERASRRERNYDQPWWAATVMALRQQVQLAPDGARALREVAAKREILAEHEHVKVGAPSALDASFGCRKCHFAGEGRGVQGFGWCKTIRALAAVYGDDDT